MSTLAHDAHANLLEASDNDLRKAIARAEQRTGCTYDELAEQARTGDYASFRARLAWVAVGGMRELLDRPGSTSAARRRRSRTS